MATFSVIGGDDSLGEDVVARSLDVDPPKTSDTDKQMVVLYTIPHDLLAVISEDRCRQRCMITTQDKKEDNQLASMYGRPKGSCNNIEFPDHPFTDEIEYPLEIRGQQVAICRNLVELAINSGPDMVLWAFSAQGWARAWAIHPGCEDAPHRTVVQADGSLRKVDSKGDYIMTEVDQTVSELEVTLEPLSSLEMALERNAGSTAQIPPTVEQYYAFSDKIPCEGSKRIINLELADVLNEITRVISFSLVKSRERHDNVVDEQVHFGSGVEIFDARKSPSNCLGLWTSEDKC
ncbi:Calcium permeable stress-gated cation channel 1 [Fusarium acuminatum]|uniref:Calcium permeable stress-gated cation channel 1 n=1 Tax=Fusarium acuminatum TaxID=5515 RepID=A0ABZ2WN87_9HYPO